MIIAQSNGLASPKGAPDERPLPPPAAAAMVAPKAAVSIPAPEQLQQAVQMISKAIQTFSRNLEFSVDDSAVGKTVVKVVDKETGDLIRQIPSQEALDIARVLDRLRGLLIRREA
jgi:flagellar protein FlaG